MSDNGSKVHVVNDRSAFIEFRAFTSENELKIMSVNGEPTASVRLLCSIVRKVRIPFRLTSVILVKSRPVNIFFERAARTNGMKFARIEDQRFDYM